MPSPAAPLLLGVMERGGSGAVGDGVLVVFCIGVWEGTGMVSGGGGERGSDNG